VNGSTDSPKDSSAKGSSPKPSDPQPSTSDAGKGDKDGEKEKTTTGEDNLYVCQYCDREFPASKLLIAHEFLHLIGNQYEVGVV
jgi:hypothetical protein